MARVGRTLGRTFGGALGLAGGALAMALVGVAAPAGLRTPAADPGAAPAAGCRCGHDAAVHEHFRPGTDCGACGVRRCPRFRVPRRGVLGRLGRRATTG
jgi:hypothetical protein